ncbi:hypothetical protein [Citricoccus nitrophenolicus]|uniref:hypothetical protein n=1 Tax=Citricoccus nitrophenolicus TaxID=863575 RepID=UPI0039B3EC93
MPSTTTRRDPSRPPGVPRRLRRERHGPASALNRRQHRRDLRRHRRAVRRRLALPPPDYSTDDAGPRGSAGSGTGDGRPDRPGLTARRRTRIRLAVASIPLVVAAVLLALTLGGGSVPTVDPAPAAMAEVQEPAAESRTPGSENAEGPRGTTGHSPGPAASLDPPPDPPPGHRSVAVRLAAPDAGALVRAGHRVDVVGPDASVLAASLLVLQDRSSAQASVLVLAVPEEEAPRLAATGAGPGLTVVRAPDQDPARGGP